MTQHRTRLLDVNVVIALSLPSHVHHEIVTTWFEDVRDWATCPITQSAYVRLLLNQNVTGFRIAPGDVLAGLAALCAVDGHEFLSDDAPLSEPLIDFSVLSGSKQVTDLHLVDLAARHRAVLATMDSRIPNALAPDDRRHVELIPV